VTARPGSADVAVAQMAAEQWGVLGLDELRACGLSAAEVTVRCRNGRLHRLHRGVYAVGHANPPVHGRWLAAVKACRPGAVLSHRAGGASWGFIDWDERCYPEVTVAGESRSRHPGIKVHRTRHLDPIDITRHDGIPVTTPARTIVDLAGAVPHRALRRAVRRAQGLHRVNVRQLLEALDRLGPRRGSARLRRIVARGPAPTRSELEDVVLELILGGGLAHPDVNAPLTISGRRIIPDFRWPEQRLVVEADGAAWHDGQVAREDDAERQALLEEAGERVLRVTWGQAVAARTRTLARFRAAGVPDAADPRAARVNPG